MEVLHFLRKIRRHLQVPQNRNPRSQFFARLPRWLLLSLSWARDTAVEHKPHTQRHRPKVVMKKVYLSFSCNLTFSYRDFETWWRSRMSLLDNSLSPTNFWCWKTRWLSPLQNTPVPLYQPFQKPGSEKKNGGTPNSSKLQIDWIMILGHCAPQIL